MSAGGSEAAASTSAAADEQAAQLQMEQYNQSAGMEAPGRNLGYGADNLLAQLYGMGPVYTGPSSLTVPNIPGGTNAMGSPGGTSGPAPYAAGGPGIGSYGSNFNYLTGYGPNGTPASKAVAPAPAGNPGTGLAPGMTGGAPNYSAFYNSPGYQFTLGQGEQAVDRNAAANGGLYSANTMTAENNYAQGAASTQYQNYVNQLNSMAGLGQVATGATVNAGTSAAEGASNSLISGGNAQASGVLGAAGGINNALTGNNGLLAAISNSNNNGGGLIPNTGSVNMGTGGYTDNYGY